MKSSSRGCNDESDYSCKPHLQLTGVTQIIQYLGSRDTAQRHLEAWTQLTKHLDLCVYNTVNRPCSHFDLQLQCGSMVDYAGEGRVMPDFESLDKRGAGKMPSAAELPVWAQRQQKVFTNWVNNKVQRADQKLSNIRGARSARSRRRRVSILWPKLLNGSGRPSHARTTLVTGC